jgi:hypothetical protein
MGMAKAKRRVSIGADVGNLRQLSRLTPSVCRPEATVMSRLRALGLEGAADLEASVELELDDMPGEREGGDEASTWL